MSSPSIFQNKISVILTTRLTIRHDPNNTTGFPATATRWEMQANNDGKIDQKEFNDAVTTCKKQCQGKKNDVQCKRMVIEVIEDNSFKVKTGMFSNWYATVKKDVNYGKA